MADIRPFRAIRPAAGYEARIAALPYDVYSREEAVKEVHREPLSFLSIDRAETQFDDSVDTYADCVYQKARELLNDRMNEGYFIQEEQDCFYVYELTMDGRVQTGIAACASVDDYLSQVIRKHENTRADKEEDRVRHVNICDAQTGPIFLAYRSDERINEAVRTVCRQLPLYDFTAPDGVRHRLWRVDDRQLTAGIQDAFAHIGEIYIADGHHRCASAVRVSRMRRLQNDGKPGPYDTFLSVLFPDDQLMILDYNRVVKDLNGLTPETFLIQCERAFTVERKGAQAYHPVRKGTFGLFLEGVWYELTFRGSDGKPGPVESLDVSILQDCLLTPVLGIGDPRTDKRIDFVGGIRGLEELERRVYADCKAAFSLYPTSIEELFTVADAGLLMPPKSTWFEPKLRSGLLIHSLKECDV